MKILLVLSLVILSLGCERARMSKTGTPPAETKAKPERFSPAPGSTPANPTQASNSPTSQEEPVKDKKDGAAVDKNDAPTEKNGPNDSMTLVQDENIMTFDGGESGTTPTCQGASCDQPILTDEGKYPTEQNLRFEPRTHELDIIFVLDTSASMRDEHQSVAREITKFISELSADVSYRIGIILAHGPRTKANVKVGSLYSEDQKNLVISSAEIGKTVSKDQVAAKVSEILTARLAKLPIDRSEAQGEAGMLNLYTAFSDSVKRNELKRAGLLGDKAALLVVTVADENDICFDYEETSRRLGKEVIGTYATKLDRVREQNAFQAQDTCRSVANGQRLTAEDVVQAVHQARGSLPVIFTGIHYLEDQVPERTDEFSKDNEAGRGYLDVIEIGKGIAVDLASENFASALTKIGNFSNFHMKYENTFFIPGKVDVKRFDSNSVSVRIRSGDGQEHPIAAGNVRVKLDSAKQQVSVIIAYEALQSAYEQKWIGEGSKLLIDYGYKD